MEKGCDFVNNLKFEISQVHAGWFVCLIGDVEIWASYIQMHDSPRQLLKLLGELICGSSMRNTGCASHWRSCWSCATPWEIIPISCKR